MVHGFGLGIDDDHLPVYTTRDQVDHRWSLILFGATAQEKVIDLKKLQIYVIYNNLTKKKPS